MDRPIFPFVPFLDRLEKLLIGSAYFDRCYHVALRKYSKTGSLKHLLLDFSITNGAFLADPYADAELESDGMLKLYWRSRRGTTKPSMSVKWNFGKQRAFWNPCYDGDEPSPIQIQNSTSTSSALFGQIFDETGSLVFEMKRSSIGNAHRFTVFHSSTSNCKPFLEIIGKPRFNTWAAKTAGLTRTSLVFRIYEIRNEYSSRILVATLVPVLEKATFSSDINSGTGLMMVKFERIQESREIKAAVLGAAFLLCLKYYMKGLYSAFEIVHQIK